MKKIISVILAVFLLMAFSVGAFADKDKDTFLTAFANQLPSCLMPNVEFEAGKTYVLYVTAPHTSNEYDIEKGEFKGLRGVILKEDIVCENVQIVSAEEDESYNFNITFIPTGGEFSFDITMRSFGYDYLVGDYRIAEDDDWVYVFSTDKYTATGTVDLSSNDASSDSTVSSLPTSSSTTSGAEDTSSVIQIDADTDNKASVWIWIAVAAAAVVCVVVVIVFNKKKLVK